MRTRLFVGLAAATLGITAIACSSASNPYPDVDAFCSAYAKAICQVSSTCQFDSGTCQTYQAAQCQASAAASSSATREYNSGNVQACINALNSAYGNSPTGVSEKQFTAYTSACAKVFVGSAQEGDACSSDYDCASSTDICASAPGRSAVCATPTQRGLNDDCGDRGDQCPVNAYCSATSVTCVASQTNGQACSDTQPCDGNDHCVNSVCVALATQGNSCTTNSDCGEDSTGAPLFCDPFTAPAAPQTVCVSALSFARGSFDCLGIEGDVGTTGGTSSSGGTTSSSGGTTSSSGGGTSSSGGSGGDAGGSSGGDAASE